MLGLTGGIACGKSTVSTRLRELGAFVIDADLVSREVIESAHVLFELGLQFGPGIFNAEGRLLRRALASAAFETEGGAKRLNAIMHPAVMREIKNRAALAEASGRYPLTVVDAALLIESGFNTLCSGVWLVTCDEDERVRRVMARDGVTELEARQRMARQMSDAQKAPYATRIIANNGSPEELYRSIDAAFAEEISRADTEVK